METLLHHPLLTTLAQALLHSLWQVSLLAGFAWLAGQYARSARVKHRIYLLAMLGAGAAFFLTLCYYLPESAATLGVQLTDLTALVGNGELMVHKVAENATPTAMSIGAIIYLFGLLLMLLHACLDLFGVARIRRQSSKASGELASLFADLVQRWRPQLSGKVQLRLSSRVSSALTLGLLRPLIVLPIGMINQLTTEEVEAILLHELAHVLRRDHLWNALQTGIRLLFFYHPLIHWLSRKIDREREYACDDLVAGRIDRQVYAQSLLRVAQFSITHKNQFIMQAQGKTHFTHRIQRLFQPGATNTAILSKPQRWWLPLLLLPLLFTAVLSAQRQAPDLSEKTEVTTESQTTVFYLDGKRYTDLDRLQADLQPGATMQSCEDGDPELAKINAAEGKQYTQIMRFFNPGSTPATPDQKAPVFTPSQLKEKDVKEQDTGQKESSGLYLNGEALEKGQEYIMGVVMMGMAEEKEPKYATFIDDTPVYYAEDDLGSDISVSGEVLHFYDNNATETIELNKKTGADYDGIVRFQTSKDSVAPKENAAKAFSLSDSILIIINDQPYPDQGILNRLDPEAIKEIQVFKGSSKYSAPNGKPYKGIIQVVLKKGYSVEDIPMRAASPEILTPGLEEAMGPGFNFENTYVSVDGQEVDFLDFEKLKKIGIESMEVIKGSDKITAAGIDSKYRAAILIKTLKASEKAADKDYEKSLKIQKRSKKERKEALKAQEAAKQQQEKAAKERGGGGE